MPEGTGLSLEIQKPEGEGIQPHIERPVIAIQEQGENIEAQGTEGSEASRLIELHQELSAHSEQAIQGKRPHNPLFGDFQDYPLTSEGKIKLEEDSMKPLMENVAVHKMKHRFDLPSYLKGHRTATEYDNKVGNFSTRTGILTMDDGKRVFAVYDYRTSFIHRFIDRVSRRFEGAKMGKVMKDWKQTYEERSNVPIIENPDPDMVLMPYIPNVNAQDLFANNKEIEDFGPVPWAKTIDLEGKMQLGEKIVDALAEVHAKGRSQGETILPNMIITPEGTPIIVDPESQYYKGVSFEEQKSRDLRDIVFSISGSLAKSEGITAFGPIVDRLLAHYPDQETVAQTQRVVSQKPGFIQKQFIQFGETLRLGIGYKDHAKVSQAVREYTPRIAQAGDSKAT